MSDQKRLFEAIDSLVTKLKVDIEEVIKETQGEEYMELDLEELGYCISSSKTVCENVLSDINNIEEGILDVERSLDDIKALINDSKTSTVS